MLTNQWQSSVKINTVVALSDLCVRFTSLIEAYLGDMCVCLRDTDIVVRTNTLTYLTQLIQEDFLKLRYPFFYYILFMLEDEVSSIREQTSAFLVNTNHRSHNNVVLSPQERAAFCMPGEGGRECRRKLYRYMLDHMQDDHRFKVTYRLCTEILDEVSEGKIRLNQVGTFVLQDALYILSCDEIRMVHLRSGKETHEDDNGEMMEEVITHVRKTIISQLVKKNYIENIVPIIIRLKHKLKEMKSSLVRDLMICLRELMKDFKEEVCFIKCVNVVLFLRQS
ncbi:hypothetical protein AAG570_003302 [Ranatra chinensis]|uniref:Condensin complex subunit 1 C-terminal domain-containing protein n=1 Tax=Ranatra chinensis TaxID=642074 RepID=A0ABD0YT56_9HEMI